MPVGPIELLDDVGIDVATKGAETLSAAWPDRMPIDASFGTLVGAGRLGRKVRKGFYAYEGERRTGADRAVYAELGLAPEPKGRAGQQELEDRLILPMVNEAAFCLAEGIVPSPDKLDLALIFGIGFPPFRGGLLRYADSRGIPNVVKALEAMASRLGPRFAPAPFLLDLARAGRKFHPA
jgi:3-hydroxyacyl-CoA dehydrogenase/enoyl-CoA hydratase/3-hydroxybutyryl-CoA epimerase